MGVLIRPVDEIPIRTQPLQWMPERTRHAMQSKIKATSTSPETSRPERSEARRQQVLNAANACFREHGFHGTSIQRVSQASGMSIGHIYHYFENKEAIVTGIVEQYLHETLELVSRMAQASQSVGVVEAVAAQVKTGMSVERNEGLGGLGLEIFAEASRNPVIAAAIQQADKVLRSKMRELFLQLPALKKLPRSELDARIAVMTALFDGLDVRALCNPSMSKTATTKVVQRIFRILLDE
ncbi:TetR/AcrR family transcriptional regulator [Variovorax sp. GB1P17]|uniref:TetR/AcrR family transcriptional regulator n=1 Tax=Variovorax sp. GB1P17 TaxID=3443740 RepID=UPI003F47B024